MEGRRGFRKFGWIITTTRQPGGAPFVDRCIVRDDDHNHYRGRAFRLSLFKRDTPTLALVVGKWEYQDATAAACEALGEVVGWLGRKMAERDEQRAAKEREAANTHTIYPPTGKAASVGKGYEFPDIEVNRDIIGQKASGIMETRARPLDDDENLAP